MAGLRVVFMGTPELACVSLQALLEHPDFQIVGVVTQPDRPKGRSLKLQPSPVKELALRAALPILQPARARSPEVLGELREWQPDLIAVAAYGQILPQTILDLPPHGCLNVHTSLLPKYRGAAPIQWAILNGDEETGVTIMKMDAGMDTGAILSQATTPIKPEDNAETLHDRLAKLGADLLVKTIPGYLAGTVPAFAQPAEGATHAPKIKKSDGQIDWNQSAKWIWNRVRGLAPWPGAFSLLPNQPQPLLLKIWQAQPIEQTGPAGEILAADQTGILIGCGRGALRVLALQREGGKRLSAAEFLAGHRLVAGTRLIGANTQSADSQP